MFLSFLGLVMFVLAVQCIFARKAEAGYNPELQIGVEEVEEVLGGKVADLIKIESVKSAEELIKYIETDSNAFYPATQNYKVCEMLLRQGGYFNQVMQMLMKRHNPDKPQAALLCRIAHAYYEYGTQVKDKKEARELYKKGIDFIAPFLDTAKGTKGERAYMIYWSALNSTYYYQSKLGVLSLFKLGAIMKILDRAINEDPKFPQNYYLKGNIYENVPFGKYGDKFLMIKNYNTGYKVGNTEKLHIGIALAKALLKRNWDVDRKRKEAKKRNIDSDGTPMNMSDQEYAIEVCKQISALYYARRDVYRAERYGKMCKEAEELVAHYKKA